jgi:hypothetical protein
MIATVVLLLALAGAAIAAWLITRQPAEQPLDLPSVARGLLFVSCSRNRASNPPTSSSLAEEERLRSLLLSTAARDFPTLAASVARMAGQVIVSFTTTASRQIMITPSSPTT